SHHRHFEFAVRVADHRSRIIRKHARHRCEVADIAVDDAEQRSDGGLVRCDAVEIAHSSELQVVSQFEIFGGLLSRKCSTAPSIRTQSCFHCSSTDLTGAGYFGFAIAPTATPISAGKLLSFQ